MRPDVDKGLEEVSPARRSGKSNRDGREQQEIDDQRHAEPQRALAHKGRRPVSLDGARGEIAREQKEQPHEEGLVEAGKQAEEQARTIMPPVHFRIIPVARGAVGDRRMVKQHEQRQRRSQRVESSVSADVALGRLVIILKADERDGRWIGSLLKTAA